MEVPRGMEPTGTNGRTRHTLSDPLVGGLGLVLWWFSRWMARNAVSCGHDDDTGKAFDLLASVVRFPDRHDRNRSCGWFRFCRPILVVGRCIGFAVVMAQVRRPVPFRTRKLRPGTAMVLHSRGCGRVARRRIQLSGPSGRVPWGIPGRSFFIRTGCFPPPGGGLWTSASRPAGGFLQWVEVFGLWKACGRTGYSSEWVIWDVATRRFVV